MNCNDGAAPSERGLRYSIDEWAGQISEFIEEVVLPAAPVDTGGEVHLVGNSLGGLLATMLAVRLPERVRSICLLNATPVWGSNLPLWDGRLPGPAVPRAIGRWAYGETGFRPYPCHYIIR